MAQKFGRNYRLTIYPPDSLAPIIVTMPFTINFSVDRRIGGQQNKLEIDIYNLSEANRKRIFQDRYVLGAYVDAAGNPLLNSNGQPLTSFNITLEAGYSSLYRIFYGRMYRASSARQGTNIITSIEAFDGSADPAVSQTFATLQKGQTVSSVAQYLISQMTNLKVGQIGNFPATFNRAVVLNGDTWGMLKDLIKPYDNAAIFIDDGKVFILNSNEVLQTTSVINDATGLLETPKRNEGLLSVTTLMETGITLGQQLTIQSSIQKEYNGTYKVYGVRHQGMISGAVCGTMKSIFTLLAPNQIKATGFKVIS